MFWKGKDPMTDRVEQLELEIVELQQRTEFLYTRLEAACVSLALQSEVIRELQLEAMGIDIEQLDKTTIN